MIHPCVEITGGSAKEFVANDTVIGGNETPSVIIVTGPNMGGKSTLLRQTWYLDFQSQLTALLVLQSSWHRWDVMYLLRNAF